MNALRHGSSSKILFERDFITRHLNEQMAAIINVQLEPIRRERIVLLTALDAAISSGKATATKALLRQLRSLERRELGIVQSSALP